VLFPVLRHHHLGWQRCSHRRWNPVKCRTMPAGLIRWPVYLVPLGFALHAAKACPS
jgi:hypothetical protein